MNISRDKLLHFSANVVLGMVMKGIFDFIGMPRGAIALFVFIIVVVAQLVDEFVIQTMQPGRNARDWKDAAAGILGGAVAAALIV